MIEVTRKNSTFYIDDTYHKEWWTTRYPTWERENSAFMDEYCCLNKVTLDIGSWNGAHALYMAGLSKKVYALEPDPKAFTILEQNIKCNPNITNIESVNKALTNYEGKIKIMSVGGSNSSILPIQHEKYAKSPLVDVDCLTFSRFLSSTNLSIHDIGFIKMDIEGAEGICIPDMEYFLKEFSGAFCLSIHSGFISKEETQCILSIMKTYFTKVTAEGWLSRTWRTI